MAEGKKEGLGRAVEIGHLKKKVLLLSEPKIEGANGTPSSVGPVSSRELDFFFHPIPGQISQMLKL